MNNAHMFAEVRSCHTGYISRREKDYFLEERSYCVLMVFEMIYLASQLHLISIMSEVHT